MYASESTPLPPCAFIVQNQNPEINYGDDVREAVSRKKPTAGNFFARLRNMFFACWSGGRQHELIYLIHPTGDCAVAVGGKARESQTKTICENFSVVIVSPSASVCL